LPKFYSKGQQYQILDEIIDHRKDNTAVPISEGMIQGPNGEMKPKITTQGHEFQCSFKDGSMDWVKLKDLKESNRIEIAKFVLRIVLLKSPLSSGGFPRYYRNEIELYPRSSQGIGRQLTSLGSDCLIPWKRLCESMKRLGQISGEEQSIRKCLRSRLLGKYTRVICLKKSDLVKPKT
jgi:hypothetical protein